MEILRCNGIKKVFGKGGNQVTALNGISRSIEKGGLLGHLALESQRSCIFWAAWTSLPMAL